MSYYDPVYDSASEYIDINYLDLESIQNLGLLHPEWHAQYEIALEVIEGAYISNELPLYDMRFMYGERVYLRDDTIKLIDNMIVLMHLAQVGEMKDISYQWVKEEFYSANGRMYTTFDLPTGSPTTEGESTAIYSMMARIAKLKKDDQFYKDIVERMNVFQVLDQEAEIYGAFGNEATLEVYSYDCLKALLAY